MDIQGILDHLPKTTEQWAFMVLAVIALFSAFEVVVQKNPLNSAIALIFTFGALAGLYVTLNAQFIAAIQIIVYAGAIIVLFVFVIMLLNVRSEERKRDKLGPAKAAAGACVTGIFLTVFYVINTSPRLAEAKPDKNSVAVGTVESIGNGLFTDYLLPFEATSVLIMMAIVGSMVLAQRAHVEVKPAAEPEASEPVVEEPEEVEV